MIAEILEIKATKNPEYFNCFLEEYVEARVINGKKLKSATKPRRAWGVFPANLIDGMEEGDYLDNLNFESKKSLTPFSDNPNEKPFTDGFYYNNRFYAKREEVQIVDAEALRLERELAKESKDPVGA